VSIHTDERPNVITETVLTIDPETQTFADVVGQPYTLVTWDGTAMSGTVDLGTDGVPVVRFEDGRWAFARYEYAV